ncbi:efflux transporter outer membrane subunit [Novispirillum itersonii]|uniref:efflux transporter outer membrane subunit n=1 Tax=Novispirillum itersonii TaxID=189 RepID=UPI00036CF748|nr:efflux transporter outer membrane subunit [Novispirillum itersonii]
MRVVAARKGKAVMAVSALVMLAACSQVPDYTPETGPLPGAWHNPGVSPLASAVVTDTAVIAPEDRWWESFGSAELNRLIEQALSDGNDLKAAVARIRQAQAQLGTAEAPEWPSLSVSGGETAAKRSASSRTTSGDSARSYSLGLSASYEVDFWGKRAASVLSAENAQQRSAVAQIRTQIAALELQHAQALNALAALLGKSAGEINVQAPGLSGVVLPPVKPGLPSDILRRRPDLRAAEARLLAANANIGEARARYYPSLTLTAERGFSSAALSSLLTPASAIWSIGGSLAAPLFDNGAIDSAVDQANARREELAATYRQSVIDALRDTEDALAANRWLTEQEDRQGEVVTASREARRLADIRYRGGAVAYMTVLDAERTLLQAEDASILVRLSRLNAGVNLSRAVGGSLSLPAVEPAAKP